MRPLYLALALALAVPGAALAHPEGGASGQSETLPAVAMEAAAAVDAFHAALAAGDTDAALALLAPDAIILEEGGAERSRDEYAAHHLGADAAFSAASHSEVTRRAGVVRGDAAWIITEGRTTATLEGRELDQRTTETMVLAREADGWIIHHIHWSSRAAD